MPLLARSKPRPYIERDARHAKKTKLAPDKTPAPDEVERALVAWSPLVATIMMQRGLFGSAPRVMTNVLQANQPSPRSLPGRLLGFLRRNVFDYFGRR
jgi:hypothetical protein